MLPARAVLFQLAQLISIGSFLASLLDISENRALVSWCSMRAIE